MNWEYINDGFIDAVYYLSTHPMMWFIMLILITQIIVDIIKLVRR